MMKGKKIVSNTLELKQYLLDEHHGFLLNSIHNGKTIMLSGEWGSGKTFFWKEEIEKNLSEKLNLKDKSSIYISLYGKNDLNALKQEVFLKASSENQFISKEVSTFGFDVLSSIKDSDLVFGKLLSATSKINDYRKSRKGINRLKDGGVICFDDFERKSKEIDLNDLFGFISQLAIEYQCKIVIILNSNVFKGEEAKVFKQVKEKTINKFLNFQPSIDELFGFISNSEKYNVIEDYKADILSAIKETEELNARIYKQVLDNCLEWFSAYDFGDIRVLVLATISFIRHHIVFRNKIVTTSSHFQIKYYLIDDYPLPVQRMINVYCTAQNKPAFLDKVKRSSDTKTFIDMIKKEIVRKTGNGLYEYPENSHNKLTEWVDHNIEILEGVYKYGIKLFIANDTNPLISSYMYDFVESGILPEYP